FVHTFHEIAEPEAYFDTHPEYFSEVGGQRLRYNTQLCLTHPDVLALAISKVRLWLDQNPAARIVSVSQNDCYNPCQCEHCRQIDEYEGSHSGTLIRFVNAIARDIAADYPQVCVDTLAYQYTRRAPRHTKPEPNVIVRLCSIECCFSHPLETCREISRPFNRMAASPVNFADDLKAWAATGGKIYIWDYVSNFAHYLAPFPNLRVLAPNLRFFARLGVQGVFEEGDYQSKGSDFAPLKAYVLARLLWDPNLDIQELTREFLEGCFGWSAGPISDYIDLLHDRAQPYHLGIYDAPNGKYLNAAFLDRSDRLFDEAETLAESEPALQRIKAVRIPVRYTRLYQTKPDDPDYPRQVLEFYKAVDEAGITAISELLSIEQCRTLMSRGLTPAQIEAERQAELEAIQNKQE
ncbi:MAG TPA: hypothetical protein DD640_01810, partial [Clostridiales bacterium]|nr:hypothetical protein [Clostridiales bacterium]